MALDTLTPGCPQGLSPPTRRDGAAADPAALVRYDADGKAILELLVDGARCAGCIRKIETALLNLEGVREARLNLTTRRLRVGFDQTMIAPRRIVETLEGLGYVATPFDPAASGIQADREGRGLLRALAVAGFGAMNVMMFSLPVWTGDGEMGDATREMLHWWSALVAVPVALYAGQTFFVSAWRSLSRGYANMDVPISLAVLITLAMSLYDTTTGGMRTYFDGVCMLLFLLLVGRYLDHRLRERARSAARDLLALQATTAIRLDQADVATAVAARDICVGDRILLRAGDRAVVDGIVLSGRSELDCAIITGETAPTPVREGETVHAGAINIGRQLTMRVTAPADSSTIAHLARLMEVGEQGRARFVRIADRAAQIYVPVVHALAALTFAFWILAPATLTFLHLPTLGVYGALTNAVAVLIITCPCALGLAVPAVQVVATGRLFRHGVLVKTGDALERLAEIDTVVFDKTGTLTEGRPRLMSSHDADTLRRAAMLARASRHPLCRALVEAAGPGSLAIDAEEIIGEGVRGVIDGCEARLGRQSFVGIADDRDGDANSELWFAVANAAPTRFAFVDALRPDAREAVAALQGRGLRVELVSGDRPLAVSAAAREAGIQYWAAAVRPEDKVARLSQMAASGARVLMVGDGINDAPALANAHASASPSAAADISQAASDIVFAGSRLNAIVQAFDVARAAKRRIHENLGLSVLYNLLAIPVAVCGLVTPLIAALAMSGSSIIVTLNAMRIRGDRPWT